MSPAAATWIILAASVFGGAGWHFKLAHRSHQDVVGARRTYRSALGARRHHVITAAAICALFLMAVIDLGRG